MRYAFVFTALIASVAAQQHAGTPTTPFVARVGDELLSRDGYQSINPPVEAVKRSINKPNNAARNRRGGHFDTNAKRLAAGLPLKAPSKRFNGNRVHSPRQTGSPCTNGVIHVAYGTTTGYLSTEQNKFGEYHTTTSSACDASALQICAYPGTTSTPSAITLVSPHDATTPYLGGVVGFSSSSASLSTTSATYFYLADTAQSSSAIGNTDNSYTETLGPGYEEPAESDIWLIAADGTMSVSWTNEDGGLQAASVGYSTQDAFVGTGSPADFTSSYGAFDVAVLTFTPSSSVSCGV